MFLSEKQIKDYQTDGVIIVKDIFKDWIEPLKKGFQKVLDSPSKHGRENINDNNGRFFEDYCNWCQGVSLNVPGSFMKICS